jgi:hypothetical protein
MYEHIMYNETIIFTASGYVVKILLLILFGYHFQIRWSEGRIGVTTAETLTAQVQGATERRPRGGPAASRNGYWTWTLAVLNGCLLGLSQPVLVYSKGSDAHHLGASPAWYGWWWWLASYFAKFDSSLQTRLTGRSSIGLPWVLDHLL